MTEETVDPVSLELEKHLARLDAIPDPIARATVTDLIAAVLEFHATALDRILAAIRAGCGDSVTAVFAELDRDPLVRSMLLLHDLHPNSLRERVEIALCDLEPKLAKREASAELVRVEDHVVHVRVTTSGVAHGPIAPAVEQALRAAAPDVEQIIVEEAGPKPAGFVPLEALQSSQVSQSSVVQK